MGASAEIVSTYHQSLTFHSQKSRLELGEVEVSYHCDKFNTRILKNFEDVLGYEKGSALLQQAAERTTYQALKKFVESDAIKSKFDKLSTADKVATMFEMFKIPAYGALSIISLSPEKSIFASKSSYLAEGWLENKENWKWENREYPACHDIRGHLSAVLSIAYGKPVGSFTVKEINCRAKGDDTCEFIGEVIKQ